MNNSLNANHVSSHLTMTLIRSFSTLLFCVTYGIVKINGDAIVEGKPANPNEFPFMAALGWTNSVTGKVDYLCGGVLIEPSFVLTAAHCVFLDGKLPDVIQIGGNALNSTHNEMHTVKTHHIYPEYDSSQSYNDIALFELNDLSWKSLPHFWNDALDELPLTAIGYGTTQFAGQTSNILLKVQLSISPEKDCKTHLKRNRKFKLGLSTSQICAGDPQGIRDTCQGDSGGPLLFNNIFVVGITSTGKACSGIPPAIYTRVSSFRNWIHEITGNR